MKTSLEKSHSKASNAKLTIICLLAIASISLFWVGIGLIGDEERKTIAYIIGIIGLAGSGLSLYLISKFTR